MNEDFYYKVNEENILIYPSTIRLNNKSKYKRCNKYFRNRKYKNDSVRNAEIVKLSGYGRYAMDKYNWFNQVKINDDYKLYSVPFQLSTCRKICKKSTNKIIRRCDNVGNYSKYRKYFDYQNMIF